MLVDNPPQHPEGDFLLEGGVVTGYRGSSDKTQLTYSGIAIFHPHFFEGIRPGRLPLAPILFQAADHGELSGEHYQGSWSDVGTPERLEHLTDMPVIP